MNLMSALRAPCHSRAVSHASPAPVDDAGLDRTMTLTEMVLVALCAARVGTDLQRGPLTLEGHLALGLLVILSIVLLATGATRRAELG
jgi:hypothetical protein